MSEEHTALATTDDHADKSPKSLDDKVLAYAKRKAQSNKSSRLTSGLPPLFSAASGLAVLVLAVLLLPRLQQSGLQTGKGSQVLLVPDAEISSHEVATMTVPQARRTEAPSGLAAPSSSARKVESEEVAHRMYKQQDLMQQRSKQQKAKQQKSIERGVVLQKELPQTVDGRSSAESSVYSDRDLDNVASSPSKKTVPSRFTKPAKSPVVYSLEDSVAEPEYLLEEIVVLDNNAAVVNSQWIKKHSKIITKLKKLFREDKLKAQTQYQLFRNDKSGLPEGLAALLDLIDEITEHSEDEGDSTN